MVDGSRFIDWCKRFRAMDCGAVHRLRGDVCGDLCRGSVGDVHAVGVWDKSCSWAAAFVVGVSVENLSIECGCSWVGAVAPHKHRCSLCFRTLAALFCCASMALSASDLVVFALQSRWWLHGWIRWEHAVGRRKEFELSRACEKNSNHNFARWSVSLGMTLMQPKHLDFSCREVTAAVGYPPCGSAQGQANYSKYFWKNWRWHCRLNFFFATRVKNIVV